MNTREMAMKTYEDIQKRKKTKREGERLAEQFKLDSMFRVMNDKYRNNRR